MAFTVSATKILYHAVIHVWFILTETSTQSSLCLVCVNWWKKVQLFSPPAGFKAKPLCRVMKQTLRLKRLKSMNNADKNMLYKQMYSNVYTFMLTVWFHFTFNYYGKWSHNVLLSKGTSFFHNKITFVKIFKFSKGRKNTRLTYVLYITLKLLRLTWMFTKAETKKVLNWAVVITWTSWCCSWHQ